jgi:hypothetical protein
MDLTQLCLNGEGEKEFEIGKVLRGEIDPLWFLSVREWADDYHGEPEDWLLKLQAIDLIMEESGVEDLIEDGKPIASYVNNGDTYKPTVVYDHKKEEFLITSWGDFYEEWKTEHVIEVDCKELAECIHALSHSPLIPWEECVEGDRDEYDSDEDFLEDAYVDIRLQVYDDHQWSFRSGDSQYDTDHRGYWGSSSVGKCVSMKEAIEIAKELIEQASEAAADWDEAKTIKVYNDGN